MLKATNSGSNSAFSEWLKLRSWVSFSLSLILVLAIVGVSCAAQSTSNSISAYADAIKQSTISERIAAMDRYVSMAGSSKLKTDALEFLVWDNLRLGHQSQSEKRAKELLSISPGNPIAVAVLNQDMSAASRDKTATANRLAQLNSAMSSLDQLGKPEAMMDRNFQVLKQQIAIMLNGAVGLSYLAIEDYPQARMALEQAVASDPNNAQLVYGMGLALLNGKNRDQYRGYWYLARAANLTAGTPQGQEINNYAWRAYVKDGGKAEGWQRYQASAAALDAPPNPETGKPQPAASVVASSRTNARSTGNPSVASSRSSSAKRTETTEASNRGNSSRKKKTPFGFEDTLHEPPSREPVASANVPANRPKVIAAPSEAVSLGILIETSLLNGQNRPAIIATLKDIVRNLRVNDEAAILVFSDQLDFEQDLTADDALLEEALGQIRPKQGKALLSGVAFAAGHLKRIGKNSNRVLLVISDGRSGQATSDTLTFRSQVSGVRIDCIGLNAGGASERALLEQVAAYSGGKASFASDSGEFRTAALQMTRTMGIAVP
ncbi:MAG TPA: VWA domain-containing protein [Candidatus Angelobacter sp.]|nr:VWA domain-containing protein [Candidatus Angelobacter sp.]